MSEQAPKQQFKIAALYRFTRLSSLEDLRADLLNLCTALQVKGTLLLAEEGINGTIAGSAEAIDRTIAYLKTLPGCSDLEVKYSYADAPPFLRMKVRLKREIVTLGEANVDPVGNVGTYVEPEDWNDLISDPDTIVIDTRNDYEVAIGTFDGAINPRTKSFRDFPKWYREQGEAARAPKVAMFCTGGIRCEKATAFLRAEGAEDVYHLKGGILRYLEEMPEEESLWQGECFVFDERVSVGHGLKPGAYTLCRACRMPLAEEETRLPEYEEGISCPHCINERSETQRARYRERQKQVEIAAREGRPHIGDVTNPDDGR